jgi:hypothetical protein
MQVRPYQKQGHVKRPLIENNKTANLNDTLLHAESAARKHALSMQNVRGCSVSEQKNERKIKVTKSDFRWDKTPENDDNRYFCAECAEP